MVAGSIIDMADNVLDNFTWNNPKLYYGLILLHFSDRADDVYMVIYDDGECQFFIEYQFSVWKY